MPAFPPNTHSISDGGKPIRLGMLRQLLADADRWGISDDTPVSAGADAEGWLTQIGIASDHDPLASEMGH
jgi:hypothetical protein